MTTTHVFQTYVRATPDQVWQTIVSPEHTDAYFRGHRLPEVLKAGGSMRFVVDDRDAIVGDIEVFEPFRRLTITWRYVDEANVADESPSRVEWNIDPVGEGVCRVRLTHRDLGSSPLSWARAATQWPLILASLKSYVETGEGIAIALQKTADSADAVDEDVESIHADWHRRQAIECNNRTHELFDEPKSSTRDEELLRRAYAAAYHWQHAARRTPANEARALWLLSKVHRVIGDGATSLRYASAYFDACDRFGLADFDLAYAHEAQARAYAMLGRDNEATASMASARAVPIADPEDREIVEADLNVPL